MKKILSLTTLFCFLSISIFAQNLSLKKKAEENPLDCALYILKLENNYSSRFDELKVLSYAFWNSNRKSDALKTMELIEDEYLERKIELHLIFAEDLIKNNKDEEASQHLLSALKFVNKNEFDIGFSRLENLAYNLALTGNDEAANKLIDSIDEKFFKAEFLVAIATGFQKKGKLEKALNILPTALIYAKDSAFEKQKYSAIASIAKKYADLGKKEQAINLFEQIKEDSNVDREIFNILFQTYLEIKTLDKAEELIKDNLTFNDSERALKLAELSYEEGNKEKALINLQTAVIFADESFDKDTNLYPYDFAENVTSLFLLMDEDVLALDFAKKVRKTVPQQFSLLKIADYYFAKQQFDSVELVLNLAFENVKNTTKNQFDFGNILIHYDGERLKKEWFLRKIANGFMLINKMDSALSVINSIEIPYYKAASLAIYNSKNKKLKTNKEILQALLKANVLMESDKESLISDDKLVLWLKIVSLIQEFGDDEKSLDIYVEILNRINNDEDLRDEEKISSIITVGDLMEKSKLKPNKKIRKSLNSIIQKWEEEL